jgi:hypothetical protein
LHRKFESLKVEKVPLFGSRDLIENFSSILLSSALKSLNDFVNNFTVKYAHPRYLFFVLTLLSGKVTRFTFLSSVQIYPFASTILLVTLFAN